MVLNMTQLEHWILIADLAEVQAPEDLVNKQLECLRGVAESESHKMEFLKSKRCFVMAVLAMSSSATGIWFNARTRSTVENTNFPFKVLAMSWM
jgi:hypothetical protein